ncbi:DUF397 domain-containing protein [Streptomyces sp. NPDC002888]|uniref:DUF397 domain-containing protein n=1 Tax=Streptomyces sp. NPDC002888 TaxID=3364668 RepID=UPI0036B50977
MAAPSTHQWFKSSYSGGSGTECVECARTRDEALVRDSKNISGPVVIVQDQAWYAFTQALRDGQMLRLRRNLSHEPPKAGRLLNVILTTPAAAVP